MTHFDTAAAAAALCLAAGALVPHLIARLPAPEPASQEPADGPPRESYADLAARPRLRLVTALVSGAAGGLVGFGVGWDRSLVLLLFLVPVGVALAVIDQRTRLLPTLVVVPATLVAILIGVAASASGGEVEHLWRAAVGLLATRSLFWVFWRVRSSGLGFGDVRLAALLGWALGYLGWPELVVGVYAGFLAFGVPGLLLAIVRRDRALLRTAYPFGPSMLLGALIGVVLGEPLAGLVTG